MLNSFQFLERVQIFTKTKIDLNCQYQHLDIHGEKGDKFKDYPESKESVDFYKEKYIETVLKNLNPHSIVNTLYRISNGKDIILLCYETPEKFCHRKLVSDWFNNNGITCREYKMV